MKALKTTLFASLAALGMASTTHAATETASFQVTITITEACTIAATPVAFGNVTRSTAATTNGTLTVNCSNGTPYAIALSNGANPDGATITATSRRMTNGSEYVPYGLYSDAGHSDVWGNSPSNEVPGTGTGADQSISVYAQVSAAATNVAGDTYADTVVATLTY